jgi:hypothetical protein
VGIVYKHETDADSISKDSSAVSELSEETRQLHTHQIVPQPYTDVSNSEEDFVLRGKGISRGVLKFVGHNFQDFWRKTIRELDIEFRRQEAIWKQTYQYFRLVAQLQDLKHRSNGGIKTVIAIGCGSLHNHNGKLKDERRWMRHSSAMNLASVLLIAEVFGGEYIVFGILFARG